MTFEDVLMTVAGESRATRRTWSAVDPSGNVSSCTQLIEQEPPILVDHTQDGQLQ